MCGVPYLSYVGYVMGYYVLDMGVVIVYECGEEDDDNDEFSYGVGVLGVLWWGRILCALECVVEVVVCFIYCF